VLHFCNPFTHTRKLFTRACDLSVGVLESFISARDRRVGGVMCLRSGYGVHRRFPFSVQRHPKVEFDYSSGRPAANTAFSLVQRMTV
jgi:hypothetical protein